VSYQNTSPSFASPEIANTEQEATSEKARKKSMSENAPKIEEQENNVSKYCPESEQNIPLELKSKFSTDWKRTNIISKFCWNCWHWHKHGVYKPNVQTGFPNVQYVCSACGHVVKK
jgi:hypothetical protein